MRLLIYVMCWSRSARTPLDESESGWRISGRKNEWQRTWIRWSDRVGQLAIAHHVVRLGQLDVTNYGDRTDFRSTQISCMLEVSGTAIRSELARRHRKKVAQ